MNTHEAAKAIVNSILNNKEILEIIRKNITQCCEDSINEYTEKNGRYHNQTDIKIISETAADNYIKNHWNKDISK